jgi:hypothetical protein
MVFMAYTDVCEAVGGLRREGAFRCALRAGFEQLARVLAAQRLWGVTIDGGGYTGVIDQFRTDTAFIVVGASLSIGVNKAPGNLKVSWKWRSSMQFSPNLEDQREYKQVFG